MQMLTREHGVYHGVVRSVTAKNNRGIYQSGNIISANWSARIADHIGSIKGELIQANAAHIMQSQLGLAVLSSLCALLVSALPERHAYINLYEATESLLAILTNGDEKKILRTYAQFELLLLSECGFGLDLESCAATNTTEDLIYVSPKSGRAVCRDAGEPYKDKLLKMPQLFKTFPLEGGRLDGGALKEHSRELRKNQTDAEKEIWRILSRQQMDGYKFRRQHPMGHTYIVDFICLEQRLIIELDGGQHAEQIECDTKRTAFLEAEGYKVLRFWNNDVLSNIEGVWSIIRATILTPPPNPPPSRGVAFSKAPLSQNEDDIITALTLTGYFLEHWLFEAHHKKTPLARERLVKMLYNQG